MKQLIAFCLFVMLNASCSNSTDDASQTHDDLIPLKVGNYWVYEYKKYSLSNKDSLIDEYMDTIMVKSKLIEGSKTIYFFENNVTYCSQSDGIWVYLFNGNFIMDKGLFFKYPSKVNDIITYNPIGLQIKTVSTNESVKTDMGDFVCYKYHLTNKDNNIMNYIAPKIGLIKSINTFYSDDIKDTVISYQTLISYHLE